MGKFRLANLGSGRAAALLLAGVLGAAFPGGAAFASPASEALIKEGTALRRSGRDAEAVKKLQAAYDLEATPRAAAQLGLCLQALGRWSEADAKLAEAISATTDPWVKKNRDTLKESSEVVKTHVGRVDVVGDPVGAVVLVNGNNVGTLPLADAVPVNEGLVAVELSAPGYETGTRSLTIAGGSYQRLVVRLVKTQTTQPAPVSLMPADQGANDPALTASAATDSEGSSKSVFKSPWFWGGVAAVVVATAVAVVLLSSGDPKSPAFTDSGDLQ